MLPTGLHRLVPRMASLVRKCVSLPHRNQIWQESCFSLPGYWLADRRSLQKEGGRGEEGEGEGVGGKEVEEREGEKREGERRGRGSG